MNKLLILLIYIFDNYPNPRQLSIPRLVKTIYLIDWKYCLEYDSQYTGIKWYFNHHGPYVNDVFEAISRRRDLFQINTRPNPYGGFDVRHIRYIGDLEVKLIDRDKKVIDLILKNIHHYNWEQFMSIVYNTYPIKTSSKFSNLDLAKLSTEIKLNRAEKIKLPNNV